MTSLSYIPKTGHYYEENAICVYNTVQCVSLNLGLAPEREQEQFAIVSLVVIHFSLLQYSTHSAPTTQS